MVRRRGINKGNLKVQPINLDKWQTLSVLQADDLRGEFENVYGAINSSVGPAQPDPTDVTFVKDLPVTQTMGGWSFPKDHEEEHLQMRWALRIRGDKQYWCEPVSPPALTPSCLIFDINTEETCAAQPTALKYRIAADFSFTPEIFLQRSQTQNLFAGSTSFLIENMGTVDRGISVRYGSAEAGQYKYFIIKAGLINEFASNDTEEPVLLEEAGGVLPIFSRDLLITVISAYYLSQPPALKYIFPWSGATPPTITLQRALGVPLFREGVGVVLQNGHLTRPLPLNVRVTPTNMVQIILAPGATHYYLMGSEETPVEAKQCTQQIVESFEIPHTDPSLVNVRAYSYTLTSGMDSGPDVVFGNDVGRNLFETPTPVTFVNQSSGVCFVQAIDLAGVSVGLGYVESHRSTIFILGPTPVKTQISSQLRVTVNPQNTVCYLTPDDLIPTRALIYRISSSFVAPHTFSFINASDENLFSGETTVTVYNNSAYPMSFRERYPTLLATVAPYMIATMVVGYQQMDAQEPNYTPVSIPIGSTRLLDNFEGVDRIQTSVTVNLSNNPVSYLSPCYIVSDGVGSVLNFNANTGAWFVYPTVSIIKSQASATFTLRIKAKDSSTIQEDIAINESALLVWGGDETPVIYLLKSSSTPYTPNITAVDFELFNYATDIQVPAARLKKTTPGRYDLRAVGGGPLYRDVAIVYFEVVRPDDGNTLQVMLQNGQYAQLVHPSACSMLIGLGGAKNPEVIKVFPAQPDVETFTIPPTGNVLYNVSTRALIYKIDGSDPQWALYPQMTGIDFHLGNSTPLYPTPTTVTVINSLARDLTLYQPGATTPGVVISGGTTCDVILGGLQNSNWVTETSSYLKFNTGGICTIDSDTATVSKATVYVTTEALTKDFELILANQGGTHFFSNLQTIIIKNQSSRFIYLTEAGGQIRQQIQPYGIYFAIVGGNTTRTASDKTPKIVYTGDIRFLDLQWNEVTRVDITPGTASAVTQPRAREYYIQPYSAQTYPDVTLVYSNSTSPVPLFTGYSTVSLYNLDLQPVWVRVFGPDGQWHRVDLPERLPDQFPPKATLYFSPTSFRWENDGQAIATRANFQRLRSYMYADDVNTRTEPAVLQVAYGDPSQWCRYPTPYRDGEHVTTLREDENTTGTLEGPHISAFASAGWLVDDKHIVDYVRYPTTIDMKPRYDRPGRAYGLGCTPTLFAMSGGPPYSTSGVYETGVNRLGMLQQPAVPCCFIPSTYVADLNKFQPFPRAPYIWIPGNYNGSTDIYLYCDATFDRAPSPSWTRFSVFYEISQIVCVSNYSNRDVFVWNGTPQLSTVGTMWPSNRLKCWGHMFMVATMGSYELSEFEGGQGGASVYPIFEFPIPSEKLEEAAVLEAKMKEAKDKKMEQENGD